MNGEREKKKNKLCKHGTINRSNSRFRTMHVMTYIFLWYNFHTSYSHQLQFVVFFLILIFFFFFISRVQNITNEQFCIQVMLYTRTGGWRGRVVLQICSTVHIIAILRIYRRSLINSNK